MSPLRLGFAFLLVSLLALLALVSPDRSLFAQEASATPTLIPFDQLPECPPFTPDPLTPTALPDFSPDAPRCRAVSTLTVDVRQLIEQGIDPATVGVPGDPLSVTPEPGAPTPAPLGTPTVPLITSLDQVTTPIATDALHQTNQLYLPALQGDATFLVATPVAAALPHQTNRLYLPVAQNSPSALGEATKSDASAAPYHLYLPFGRTAP